MKEENVHKNEEKKQVKNHEENDIMTNMPNEEKPTENVDIPERDDVLGAKSDEDIRNQQVKDANQSEDEISFEEVNEEGEVDARDTIKKLRAKIKTLEKEKQENMNGWQRAQADYANFKKEVETNRKEDIKFANKKLVLELLPVLDAYDMAKANEEAWNKVDQNWRVGIEYIFNQLTSIFEKEGIIQFGKVGDKFDPSLHESIEHVSVTDEKLNDTLVQVLQKGYKIGDLVLRPARVKTGEFKK